MNPNEQPHVVRVRVHVARCGGSSKVSGFTVLDDPSNSIPAAECPTEDGQRIERRCVFKFEHLADLLAAGYAVSLEPETYEVGALMYGCTANLAASDLDRDVAALDLADELARW